MEPNKILPDYSFLDGFKDELRLMKSLNDEITQLMSELFIVLIKLKESTHQVQINTMFRQLVKLNDSISPLILYGKSDIIRLISRSSIDTSAKLLFMVQEDIQFNSMCYLFCTIRDKMRHLESIKNPQYKKENVLIEKLIKQPTFQERRRLEINEYQKKLLHPSFNTIRQKVKNKKILNNKPWYTLVDAKVQNLEHISRRVDLSEFYHFYYKSHSEIAHSGNTNKNATIVENGNSLGYYDVRFPFMLDGILDAHHKFILVFLFKFSKAYLPSEVNKVSYFYTNIYLRLFKPLDEFNSKFNI